MKKESKKTVLMFLIVISIFLILLIPLSSAFLISDLINNAGDFFKKLFNFGDEKIKGRVGELYTARGTNYGYIAGCYDDYECNDNNLCTRDLCENIIDPQGGRCVHNPITPCCGNGKIEAREQCDDGNLLDGDGCSGECELEGCEDNSDCEACYMCVGRECVLDDGQDEILCSLEESDGDCKSRPEMAAEPEGDCHKMIMPDIGDFCDPTKYYYTENGVKYLECTYSFNDVLDSDGDGYTTCDLPNGFPGTVGDDDERGCWYEYALPTEGICCPGKGCVEEDECVECADDSECEEGDECVDGECKTPCEGDEECEEGEKCVDGYCEPSCGDGTCDKELGEDCNNCEEDCGCPESSEDTEWVCEAIVVEKADDGSGSEGSDSGGTDEYKCCQNSWTEGECRCEEEPAIGCDCSCGIRIPFTNLNVGCTIEDCGAENHCIYQARGKYFSMCKPDTEYCPEKLKSANPVKTVKKFCDINSPFYMWEYPDSNLLWTLEQGVPIARTPSGFIDCVPQCTNSPGCRILSCRSDQEIEVVNGVKMCVCKDPEKEVVNSYCVCKDKKVIDRYGNCICPSSDQREDDYGNCICKGDNMILKDGLCICKNGLSRSKYSDCEFPEITCYDERGYTGTCSNKESKKTWGECCEPNCEGKQCGHDGCGGDCADKDESGSDSGYDENGYPKDQKLCENGVAKIREYYCYNDRFDYIETERPIQMDLKVHDPEPYEIAAPVYDMVFAGEEDRVRAEFKVSYADTCTVKYPNGAGNILTDTISPAYGSKEYEVAMNEPGVFAIHCDNNPCDEQPQNNIDPFTGELANALLKAVGIEVKQPVNDCEKIGYECATEAECPPERRSEDNLHACIHESKVCCSKPDVEYSEFTEFVTGSVNPDADTPMEIVNEYVEYTMHYNPDDEKAAVKGVMKSLYDWGTDDTQNANPSASQRKNLVSEEDLEKLANICSDYANAPNLGADANPIQKKQFETKKACMAYKINFEETQSYHWPMYQEIFPEDPDFKLTFFNILMNDYQAPKRRVRWNAYIVPGFNTYTVYLKEPEKILPGVVILMPPRKWYNWPRTILRLEENIIYIPFPERKWYPYVTVPLIYSLKEASKNREQELQNVNRKTAILEFALYMVPFGESADQAISFGNYKRAGIAFVRDLAGLFTGGTGKAAGTFTKVVTGVARTTEVGFAAYDMYPSARAIYEGEGTTTDKVIVAVNGFVIGGNLKFAITQGVKSTGKLGNVPHVDPDIRDEFIDAMVDAYVKRRGPVVSIKLNKKQAQLYRKQWKQLDEITDIQDPQELLDGLTEALGLGKNPAPGTISRWGDSNVLSVVHTDVLVIDEKDIIRVMGDGNVIPGLKQKEWAIEAVALIKNSPARKRFYFYPRQGSGGIISFPTIKVKRLGGALDDLGNLDFEKEIKRFYAAAVLEETQHALGKQFGRYNIAYVSPLTDEFEDWVRATYTGKEMDDILMKLSEADIMSTNTFFMEHLINDEFIKNHAQVRRAYLRFWNEHRRADFVRSALDFRSARRIVTSEDLEEVGNILYEAYRRGKIGYPEYQQEASGYLAYFTKRKIMNQEMDALTYRALKNGNVVGTISSFDSPTAKSFGDHLGEEFIEVGWLASNEGESIIDHMDNTMYKLLHDAKAEGKKKLIAKTNRIHARTHRHTYGKVADAADANDIARSLRDAGKPGFENVIEADEARRIISTTYAEDPNLDKMLENIKDGQLFEKIDFEDGRWGVLDLEFTTFDVDKWYAQVKEAVK